MSPFVALSNWYSRSRAPQLRRATALAAILLLAAPPLSAAGPAPRSPLAHTLTIDNVSYDEGDSGSTQFVFTLTLLEPSDPFLVDADIVGVTATAGSDFTAEPTGTIGWRGVRGETRSVFVEVLGDTDVEPDETFQVVLSNLRRSGTSATIPLPTILDGVAVGTIKDDDGTAPETPTLSISDVTLQEGNSGRTNFDFKVTLSAASDPFSIQVATSTTNGTAVDGTQAGSTPEQDFIPKQETLNFAGTAGEQETFRVQVLGDTVFESDETFFVNLGAFGGSASKPDIADGQGLGTITNDDRQAGLEISPYSRGYDNRQWTRSEILVRGFGAWNAGTNVSWIEIVSAPGEDAGSLFYRVAENPDAKARTGAIFIGSEVHLVVQGGVIFSSSLEDWTNPIKLKNQQGSGVGFSSFVPMDACASSQVGRSAGSISNDRAFERCTIGLAPAATLLIDYFAVDINGDGAEEVAVKGIDPDGSSRRGRGAWMQFYDDKGKRLLNVFPGANFAGLQLLTLDVDGNGKAEPVVLGTRESGASELQLLSAKQGKVQDRASVSPAGAQATQLLAFEFDGRPGAELGVAYTAMDGSGHFAVWGLAGSGKTLEELAPDQTVIGDNSEFHEWLPSDIDGDGRSEIVAGYAGPSGQGATLRVVDPVSGEVLLSKQVLSTSFDQTVWRSADFDRDKPGSEILVGYRRKSSAGFKVIAGDGKVVSRGRVSGRTTAHTWEVIRSRPGDQGAMSNLVFVGLTRSNGDRAFEVWDPSNKKAKRVGGGTVASDDSEVLAWLMQDFDGDADNGPEIVAVTRRLADGSVGFQMFGPDGEARGARVEAFDGNYISVIASPIVFASKTRVDLKLTARTVGGQPVVHVWNVATEVRLKVLDVLSSDVQ